MKKINKNIVLKIGIILVIFITGILGFSLVSYSEEKKDVFQDCIDKEFKKADKKAKEKLDERRIDKDKCFKNGADELKKCIDDVETDFGPAGEFATSENLYGKICEKKVFECAIKKQKIGTNESQTVMNLEDDKGACTRLKDIKLSIYKSTGYEILNKNKYDVEKKFWDKLTERERKMYGDVLKNYESANSYLKRLYKHSNGNNVQSHVGG